MDEKLKPVTPGELLLEEFLLPMGITKYRLAKEIGVPAQRIGEIVAGRRAITADTDLRLCCRPLQRLLAAGSGGLRHRGRCGGASRAARSHQAVEGVGGVVVMGLSNKRIKLACRNAGGLTGRPARSQLSAVRWADPDVCSGYARGGQYVGTTVH